MSEITKILNAAEIARAQQQAQQVANAANGTIGSNTFVFYAGFDGTNNNRDNLSLSGTTQSTAVGLLTQKVEALQETNSNVAAKYYAGPGTEDSVSGSSLLPGAVTAEALRTAENAYKDFREAALGWLDNNPAGTISVMDVSFSRGAVASVAFKQLVYERGLIDGNGRVLIEPGSVQFAPSLMIDPVLTGAYGNAALPPGAAEHTTVVRAENEQRSAFKAADFSDPAVTYIDVTGNHGDAGGFYDAGLGGIYVEKYAEFFRNTGLALGSLPSERVYSGSDPVVIHAETTIYGLPWPTYEGPRQTDVVGSPGLIQRFDDGSTLVVFDDLKGNRVYAAKDTNDQWSDVDVVPASEAHRSELQAEAALAGLDLIESVRHHNKVGTASAVLRLTEAARRSADLAPLPELQAAGGALMILGAWDGLQNGTDAQKFASAARMVLGANEVAKAMNDGKGFLDGGTGFTPLNVAGGVVAIASLESTLKSGNPFAIASSFMALTNAAVATGMVTSTAAAGALGMEAASSAAVFGPQAMIAVAIASIVFGSLFGDEPEYPAPPPAGTAEIGHLADGSLGLLIKDSDGHLYQTRQLTGEVVDDEGKATDNQDWGLGASVLSERITSLIADLQAQADKDGTHLLLERLPSVSVHGYPSFDGNGINNFFFALQFNNAVSGAQQMLATAHQDLAAQFKEVASYAGALVGETEWAQIQAKQAAGDATTRMYATETEGQYVDRMSGAKEGDSLLTQEQTKAQADSNRQTYSLLTLDLEGDGITRRAKAVAGMDLDSVKADTTQGITRLDVDNDGFMELTEWVGSKEAILGIDRNGDGQLSAATELLTGGELSDGQTLTLHITQLAADVREVAVNQSNWLSAA